MEATAIKTNSQLGTYFKQMEKADKALMITYANKYMTAKRTKTGIQAAFNEIINLIEKMQTKYSFNVLNTGDNVLNIVNDFAEKIEMATNVVVGGKTYFCNFNNLSEANTWLINQNNIIIKDFSVNTSRVGLDVTAVKITYTVSDKPLNKRYQITEVMKHRFFAGSNYNKFRRKWQEANPDLHYVQSYKFKWGFSLFGGSVGYFRYIKEKYVILYSC